MTHALGLAPGENLAAEAHVYPARGSKVLL
jgi:hypothetical protein